MNRGMASSTTTIYVDPSISTATPDQEFTVAIEIANVEFLYTWRFDLEWNPNLLNATSVIEGSFLNQEKTLKTALTSKLYVGKLMATCTLKGVASTDAPSGSGTLATVTFLVKAEGECPLHFNFTRLTKFEGINPVPIPIPHTSEDGYFKYPLPRLYVEPSSILDPTLVPGSNFTVDIDVAEVTDLYSWQFFLYWEPSMLNATSVIEGSFLNQNGTHQTDFLGQINQTGGYVYANCTLKEPVPGVNGNGTIASISFLVEAKGQTALYLALPRPSLPALDKSKLVDSEKALIYHATENGFFSSLVRDIAVTRVEAFPTTVKAGDSVTINVTVKNPGVMNETLIDVSVITPSPPSPSFIPIGTQTIPNLEPDQEIVLTFSWNTKNVAKGEYTIRAEASMVSGDVDPDNNVLDMVGTVKVTSPGQFPITLAIGVVIAVVVIGIAMFLYIRRGKPPKA